jgi:hypothetical protein
MSRLRHPSPALIIALIALILSLAGSALAASRFIITSTKQISPSVLHSLKGRRGPRGFRGASGAPGVTGAPGHMGAAGTTATVTTTTTTTTPAPTTGTDLKYYGEVIASGLAEPGVGANFSVVKLSTGVYELSFPLSIAPSDLNSDGSNGCPVVIATALTLPFTAYAQPGTCSYEPEIGFTEDVNTYNDGAPAIAAFNFVALPNH